MNTNDIRDYVVACVLNTRELCGNERQAAIDAAADCGKHITKKGLSIVMQQVNEKWAEYQKQAGVFNPVNGYERATINKDLG